MPRSVRVDSRRPPPLLVRVVIVPLVVAAILAAGGWLFVAQLAPADRWIQIGIGVAWFVAAAVVLRRLVRDRPGLTLPVRASVLVVAAIASAGLYWTSFRDTVVNEQVAVAATRADPAPAAAPARPPADPPVRDDPAPQPAPAPAQNVELAAGTFHGLDGHGGGGAAQVVKLAEGGRVVTFTSFDVDAGPRVIVYLTPDESTTSGDVIPLGELKGNRGNQQYEIPASVDLDRYDTVLLWCEPFSVRIAAADLA